MKLIRTVACGIQAPALPQRLGDGSLELCQLEQTILPAVWIFSGILRGTGH